MTKMIAFCGLVCSECPTFLATQNDDDRARERTSTFYREKFGLDLRPEEINCDGCLSDGSKLIGYRTKPRGGRLRSREVMRKVRSVSGVALEGEQTSARKFVTSTRVRYNPLRTNPLVR